MHGNIGILSIEPTYRILWRPSNVANQSYAYHLFLRLTTEKHERHTRIYIYIYQTSTNTAQWPSINRMIECVGQKWPELGQRRTQVPVQYCCQTQAMFTSLSCQGSYNSRLQTQTLRLRDSVPVSVCPTQRRAQRFVRMMLLNYAWKIALNSTALLRWSS